MQRSSSELRVVGPAGLALGLSLAGDASLYAVLPSRPAAAGVEVGVVGLLLSINRLARLGFNPLSGLIHDHVGRRAPFVVALLLATLSTALYAADGGLWLMLVARVIWGASWALILVGAYSMLMDVASPGRRGLLSGLLQTAYFLGAALGLVGALLSDLYGFRTAMLACAAITAVGLLAALSLPETLNRRPGDPPPAATGDAGGRLRELVAINLLQAIGFFCANGVFYSTLGRFLRQGWGESVEVLGTSVGVASLTGSLLACRSLIGLVAGPVAGRLSDRVGRWPVVAGSAALAAGGFWGLSTGAVLPAMAGGAALLFGTPAMGAILAALTGDRASRKRYGLSFGGLAMAGDAGSAAGPLAAYALMAVGVSLNHVYAGCAVTLAAAGAGACYMAASEKRPS